MSFDCSFVFSFVNTFIIFCASKCDPRLMWHITPSRHLLQLILKCFFILSACFLWVVSGHVLVEVSICILLSSAKYAVGF